MFRSKVQQAAANANSVMFQSLFSWMFRSKLNSQVSEIRGQLFQSLFSWMFRSKPAGLYLTNRYHPVSILVLVDVSFEVCCNRPYDPAGFKFQSLFSWMFRSKVLLLSTHMNL